MLSHLSNCTHLSGFATDCRLFGTETVTSLCISTDTAGTWPRTTALTCGCNTKSNMNEDEVSNPLFLVLTHSEGSCSALVSHSHRRRQTLSSVKAGLLISYASNRSRVQKAAFSTQGMQEQHSLLSSAPITHTCCVRISPVQSGLTPDWEIPNLCRSYP